MKRKTIQAAVLLLCMTLFLMLQIGAANGELHWYCTRQKAHRQALAAPELRFVEEYGAYYIDHTHKEGDADRVVYLTFDVGYENGNVSKILDTLRETDTVGAFFVLEHPVRANTDLLKRMSEEGHLICNHTANHPNLARATRETIQRELEQLENACREIGVATAPYFRPPEGNFSKEMLERVQELGYKTVFWSFAYADWDNARQMAPDAALRCILDNIHNGAVLLLHPTSATNAEILPRLICELKAQGYRFGSLHELCAT